MFKSTIVLELPYFILSFIMSTSQASLPLAMLLNSYRARASDAP